MIPIFMVDQNYELQKKDHCMKGFYLIERVKDIISEHSAKKDGRCTADPLFF